MKILEIIDNISVWSGKIFRWSALALSVVVIYEVVSRYVFNRPTIWAFDTTMFIYSVLYLMGAAFVLQEGKHIRVDVIYMRFSQRAQAFLDLVFYVVFFFPFVIVMVWWGGKATLLSFRAEEISNTSQWGEQVWVWKFLVPLGFFLMFLQGIPEIIRTIRQLGGHTNGT